jgi:hypothetical protein
MIKPLSIVTAMLLTAPALAQMAEVPAPGGQAVVHPLCSATVTDGCQQSKAQQARGMTGAQVDARDARSGGKWTPDTRSKLLLQ